MKVGEAALLAARKLVQGRHEGFATTAHHNSHKTQTQRHSCDRRLDKRAHLLLVELESLDYRPVEPLG